MGSITIEMIKNIASSRSTEVIKEDLIVAKKNLNKKNNDTTKTVFYALKDVLMVRITEEELVEFENALDSL